MQTKSTYPGEFPSGQRGQTVNLLRFASMVRIRPPPPQKRPVRMNWSFLWWGSHRIRKAALSDSPVDCHNRRGFAAAKRIRCFNCCYPHGGFLLHHPILLTGRRDRIHPPLFRLPQSFSREILWWRRIRKAALSRSPVGGESLSYTLAVGGIFLSNTLSTAPTHYIAPIGSIGNKSAFLHRKSPIFQKENA